MPKSRNPFSRSEAPELVFSAIYLRGSLAPSAFPSTGSGLRFPPLINHEKTALSDSAAFDKPLGHEPLGHELEAEWLRPRASRGELVAGRQSLQKGCRDSFQRAGKGKMIHKFIF